MTEHDYAKYLAEAINGTIRAGWLDRMSTESDYDTPEDIRVRWQTDESVILEGSRSLTQYGHFRVTVLVEPAESWRQVTWRDVAEESKRRQYVPVRLGDVEAAVISATVGRWHVKPGTGDARWNPPVPQEHEVVEVKLKRANGDPGKLYRFPPSGPVFMLVGSPIGPAVANLVREFDLGVEGEDLQ